MYAGFGGRVMKSIGYLSGKSERAASEILRDRQSISNELDTFRLHLRSSTVLNDEVTNAFDPNSPAIKIWDQVLLFGFLFELFLLPIVLAFGLDQLKDVLLATVIEGACEMLFVFDLYVKAHTGFYSDGNLVRDRSRTRPRYFRSVAFALDLVALIPFTSIPALSVAHQNKFSLVKLVRIYRMVRFVASLDEFYTAHFVAVKLLKVIVVAVFLSHVIACVRIVFGYNTDGTNEWLPEEPGHGHSDSVRARYLQALFWGFGVLTGLFEGELPHTSAQFLFTISVACCGFFMFVTLCATIFVISKCESGQSEAIEARINQLVHLLSYHRVPESVQAPAIEYMRRHYTDAESNDREAIKLLCPSIATDIQVELLKTTVADIPMFEGCTEQFIVAITSMLKAMAIPAHTVVFSAGDVGDAMYIVHAGVLNVIINNVKVREMRKGVCFGEVSVLSDMQRTATVESATYSILYQLSRFHCERVLEGYPVCAALVKAHIKRSISGVGTPLGNSSTSTESSRFEPKVGSKLSYIGKSIKKNFSSAKKSAVLPTLARFDFEEDDDSDPNRGGASLGTVRATSGDDTPASSHSGSVAEESANRTSTVSNHLHHLGKYYDQAHTTDRSDGFVGVRCGCAGVWMRLLPKKCIDADSEFRKRWLLLLQVNLMYYWAIVPMQLVFPIWQHPSATFIFFDVIMDVGLLVDLVLNFRLSFTVDAEKIMDPRRSAQWYLRRGFLLDLACVLPCSALHPFVNASYGVLRLPRLARLLRLPHHLDRFEHFFQLTSKHRLVMFGILMCMMYHVIACLHFGTTYVEGFSHKEDAWIPCDDIYLRVINASYYEGPRGQILHSSDPALRSIATMQYFRSLYYATNVLAALGKTIEPDTETQYAIALLFMLMGFLITAIVVDNVQKRFTASAIEQKNFFATRTRIQLFLRRQNAPSALHHRVNSFLDFWWSAHRGATIEELLADLPPAIKLDVLRSICRPVLQTIALLAGVRPALDKMEEFLVEHVQFILYGQGETIYWKGDYVTGMFFLLEGEVSLISPDANGNEDGVIPRVVPTGSFFGAAAIADAEQRGDGYAEHARAVNGSIVLFLTREHLSAMSAIFPALFHELHELERRLMSSKLAKADVGHANHRASIQMLNLRQSTSRRFQAMIFGVQSSGNNEADGPLVFDPDSVFVLAWETTLFVIMSVQWVTIIYQVSFRTIKSTHMSADAITAVLEMFFVVDMAIRTRLGYYEYGSKVIEPRRIRRAYMRSAVFALDVAALIPLHITNWFLPAQQRLDLLNINKLLRLFKVPHQLHTLETRYLKITIELRLFKLVYYAFMLSHIFGCIWFDFGSNSSDPHAKPVFGSSSWLPPAYLQFASASRQYFASLFWAFGLMSASSTGELPKTTTQCLFSVFTMTSGFFLFAYVVGNFTDIIELVDAENREFNERLGSLRQLLAHFKLPVPLQERLKTFYLFRRFHSITREHILARCLPPSLLTDIRLVHLKPMIDKVEFLSGMDSSVTRLLVSQFGQLLVTRDEFVCRFGDDANEMFFVFVGVLDVLVPDDTDSEGDISSKSAITTAPPGSSRKYSLPEPPNSSTRKKQPQQQTFKKLNAITAGGYFGENGLFTRSRRNAAIQARTSCILYKLSRESLELVFDRYPGWKQRVMRLTSIREEQARLAQLAAAEVAQRPTYEHNACAISPPPPSQQQHQPNSRLGSVWMRARSSVLAVWSSVRRAALLVIEGAEAQSAFHLMWLRLTVLATVYMAAIVPYRITMDALERSSPVATALKALEVLWEVFFVVDIWFSWHVRRSAAAMELYEQPHRAQYKKERLVWDAVAAVPLDRLLSEFTASPWLRLLRCAKTVNVVRYLDELNRRSVRYELHYAARVILLYFLAIYWAACAYLAISMHEGFGADWDAWRPATSLAVEDMEAEAEVADAEAEAADQPAPAQLLLVRFLRAVFYATTAFVKKGRTFTPDSTPLLEFSIAMSFGGLLVMSFVLGELATLFLSSIGLELSFRKRRVALEQFLARAQVGEPLQARAHAFMVSLWSSHAGVDYEEVLGDMPPAIRSSCVRFVSRSPVDWFVARVFRPCARWSASPSRSSSSAATTVDASMDALALGIARRLRFEGYPGGERVLAEGCVPAAMYFVLRGHLELLSRSVAALASPVGLRRGDFFGERGLLGGAVSAVSVRAVRACDLLALRPEALRLALQEHAAARLALDVVRRAHAQLRASPALASAGPSRADMETHWGRALLRVVRELAAAPTDEAADARELVREMARALETPAECLDAFGALLHVALAADPFSWQATVGRAAAATAAAAEDARTGPAPRPVGDHESPRAARLPPHRRLPID